jgi:hypothetical protein
VRHTLAWIGCLGLSPTLLVGPLASFASTSSVKDSPRIATDSISGEPVRTRQNYKGACEHSTSGLCYDQADRRIVYTPARHYMPKFEGLTAESVSLRRDAIRFKYSFR